MKLFESVNPVTEMLGGFCIDLPRPTASHLWYRLSMDVRRLGLAPTSSLILTWGISAHTSGCLMVVFRHMTSFGQTSTNDRPCLPI